MEQENLVKEGYYLLKGQFSDEETNYINNNENLSKSSIPMIRYLHVQTFINSFCLNSLHHTFKWEKDDIKYDSFSINMRATQKTRLMHNDVVGVSDKFLNMYTCLCFLDTNKIQLVPKSHVDIDTEYMERITLDMNKGDMLVLHCSLNYRIISSRPTKGVKLSNEKVIEVYGITHDEDYDVKYIDTYDNFIVKNLKRIDANSFIYSWDGGSLHEQFWYWMLKNNYLYKSMLLEVSSDERTNSLISYKNMKLSNDLGINKYGLLVTNNGNQTIIKPSNIKQIILLMVIIIIVLSRYI
jgi:hypothetical protein